MIRTAFASALTILIIATPLPAQVGVRGSTAAPDRSPGVNDEIVVQGQRRSVMRHLRDVIARDGADQLARFEDKVCPMVIGMPRDLTAAMTRMIRANVESFGAKAESVGCKPNGLVIFIDRPAELVEAIRKEEPWMLGMAPRTARNFVDDVGAITSWHVTETRGAEGQVLGGYEADGQSTSARTTRSISSSRLYTPARQEMQLGIVVIEKGRTIGHTLRQLSDLATMHLLLEIKASAATKDPNSILSLFEPRPDDQPRPQRLSRLDRGAMAGFYQLRANNLSSAQQRENIAKAMERGAGEAKE
ncbi:MAG: hypothetical protein V4696_04985 [Pseudomonadota bacterium]